jgi:hypothetical protein
MSDTAAGLNDVPAAHYVVQSELGRGGHGQGGRVRRELVQRL